MITIYTDGISKPNPGECGCGVVLLDKDERIIGVISEYLGVGTNNVAELTGILRAISRAKEMGETEVLLYTDSEVCIKLLTKKKTSVTRLQPILSRCLEVMEGMNVRIEWVKGHDNNKWNEVADRLANASLMLMETDKLLKDIPPDTKKEDIQMDTSVLYLKCPFSEKDEVKKLGARWNADAKKWTVKDIPANHALFSKWL